MASEDQGIERLFENLPVEINVGFPRRPETVIGFAHGHRTDDGETHIHITLHEDASKQLGDLVETFELFGLGFVGRRRRGVAMPTLPEERLLAEFLGPRERAPEVFDEWIRWARTGSSSKPVNREA